MKIHAFIVAVVLATLVDPLQARDSNPERGEAHTVPMDTRNQLLASLGTKASVIWANPTRNRLEGAGYKGVVPVLERLRKPFGLSRDDRSGVLVWTSLEDEVVRTLDENGTQTSLQTALGPDYTLIDENPRAQSGYYIEEGLLLRATKDQDDKITREVLAELSFEPGLIALDEYRAVVYLADKWGRVVQRFDVREREASQLNYEGGFAVTRLPEAAPRGTLFDPSPRDWEVDAEDEFGYGFQDNFDFPPPPPTHQYVSHAGDNLPPDPMGQPRPITGFVDLHSHLMAERAFGGNWFAGVVNGPSSVAVGQCDGGSFWGNNDHADLRGGMIGNLLGGGLAYDVGYHPDVTHGDDPEECVTVTLNIPGTPYSDPVSFTIEMGCPEHVDFEHWPHSESLAHQQMHEDWIKQSYHGGLRILVASLVESRLLCQSTEPDTRDYTRGLQNCDEMFSIRKQAEGMHQFAQANADWVQIAYSSVQAREIIEQGKLALVLAVEATELFPSGDFVAQLDIWHSWGIRSVQVVHHADNRFSGAAPLPHIVLAANIVEDAFPNEPEVSQNDFACSFQELLLGCENPHGLTEDGAVLLQEMMSRGMVVDVAHLSRAAFSQTYESALANYRYPLLYSHAHLFDAIAGNILHSDGGTHHEKYITAEEIEKLNDVGGMLGLRAGPERAYDQGALQIQEASREECAKGTAWDFAQSLKLAIESGLTVGFGADFNGFMAHAQKCTDSPIYLNHDLKNKGLAHIGLLPALIQGMEQAGLASEYVSHLRDESAENFLQLWRRSEWTAGITPVMPAMPIAECTAELSPYASESGNYMVIASLDASASSVYVDGNVIVGFEWDLDDGEGFSSPVPHATTASVSFQSNDALNNCSVSPQVRITDLYGNQSVASCGSFQAVCSVAPTGG